MTIQYTKHNDIDFNKWDECISKSLNGIVYAYSWYLNIVAGEWDALVGDDYVIVFPLVTNTKFGISYIYQPFFTQQLGAFSASKVERDTIELFLKSIPPKFRYTEINLNSYNTSTPSRFSIQNRVTYQLELVQPYINLVSNFNQNTRRNISKSIEMGVVVERRLPVDKFIKFYKENLGVPLPEKVFEKLRRIIQCTLETKVGEIYASFTAQGILCASAFFIKSNNKVIYLAAASSELGKKHKAMFVLVDNFINYNAKSNLTIDFEGSNIENIARFYAGFGAAPITYQRIVINNLPWFLKPFKR